MTPPATTHPGRIAAWVWPLIALRLAVLALALGLHIPLYYLAAPFSRRNPVPRLFLRTVAGIVGIRLRTQGTRHRGDTFFLANHVSWMDIPAIAGTTGCAFVAHDGLAQIASLRWLCELNDTVFIARHDRRSVGRQVDQVRNALADTGALAIFPEGTTSDGTDLLPFKSSLLSAMESEADHIAVQPLWLDFGPETATVCWGDGESGLANALRILARVRPVDLTIHFLPLLDAEARADRKRMAAAARGAIETAMLKKRH